MFSTSFCLALIVSRLPFLHQPRQNEMPLWDVCLIKCTIHFKNVDFLHPRSKRRKSWINVLNGFSVLAVLKVNDEVARYLRGILKRFRMLGNSFSVNCRYCKSLNCLWYSEIGRILASWMTTVTWFRNSLSNRYLVDFFEIS